MTIEDVRPIIVEDMSDNFDSHDFIKELIWQYPAVYGRLLVQYDDVRVAHRQIGKFLLDHASVLEIEKTGEDETDDIFGHATPCAKWKKLF